MLAQSLSLSILLAAPAALFVVSLGGDASTAARVAGLAAALALLAGGLIHARLTYDLARARVARAWAFQDVRPLVVDALPEPRPVEPEPKPVQPVKDIRLVMVHTNKYGSGAYPPPRLVPTTPEVRLDGVPECDLKFFIEGLIERGGSNGHTRRKWLGCRMPSGRRVDADYHDLLVSPLVKCAAITGRAPRVAGTVTMPPQDIKRALGLAP